MNDSAAVCIRPAAADDFRQWLPLWNAYLRFYRVTLPDWTTELTWSRITTAGGDQQCVLSIDGAARITGFAIYLFHRSSWAATWNCLIEDLYVEPQARGSGTAARLFAAVFALADARQCYRTYWQTNADNHPARRAYDKLGRVAPVVQYRRRDPL